MGCMLRAEPRVVQKLVMEEEIFGHNGLLIEDLDSEVVTHRSGKPLEIHMVAEVVVGFGWMTCKEVEHHSLLVGTRMLETHNSNDRQMLHAGTQLDCRAEGQLHNCCSYRYTLAFYYSEIQAVSTVVGCRQTVMPDEMIHFGAGSRPDLMRRKVVGMMSALP